MMTGLAVSPLSFDSSAAFPGLIIGQAMSWLPSFLTPLWVIAIAILLGAAVSIAFYGLLTLLSFIPPLGKLADSPSRGITASLIVGGLIAAALCAVYVPLSADPEFAHLLYLPLITVGLTLGFATIYGMWDRTRGDWKLVFSEGIIPYVLSVAGLFVVIGLAATPFVKEPMAFFEALPAVNLFGDGTSSFTVTVPGNVEDDPDAAPFVPANELYSLSNLSELAITTNRNILIADSSNTKAFSKSPTEVSADEPLAYKAADDAQSPIPGDPSRLHIQNREVDPAEVTFTLKALPAIPEVASLLGISIGTFLFVSFMVAFRQAALAFGHSRSQRPRMKWGNRSTCC